MKPGSKFQQSGAGWPWALSHSVAARGRRWTPGLTRQEQGGFGVATALPATLAQALDADASFRMALEGWGSGLSCVEQALVSM